MWQQRLYAFLLRKLVGPYLTAQSRNRLHQSLDVSLREGRLQLQDIDLDGPGLADRLGLNLTVLRAHVRTLSVSLSVVYDSSDATINEKDTTTDRSNTNTNTSTTTSNDGTRLVAVVRLDGLDLDVLPSPSSSPPPPSHHSTTTTNDTSTNKTTTTVTNASTTDGEPSTATSAAGRAKWAIQSYVRTAMDSLETNLFVTDLRLTMSSPFPSSSPCSSSSSLQLEKDNDQGDDDNDDCHQQQQQDGTRLTLAIASVSITNSTEPTDDDSDDNHGNRTDTSDKTVISGKDVCIGDITLSISKPSSSRTTNNDTNMSTQWKEEEEILMNTEGDAKIRLRTYTVPLGTSPISSETTTTAREGLRTQRVCEIVLHRKIECNFGSRALERFIRIVSDLTSPTTAVTVTHTTTTTANDDDDDNGTGGNEQESCVQLTKDGTRTSNNNKGDDETTDSGIYDDDDDDTDDEEDMGLLSNILRQQMEAHHLASTQKVRGGLLLPDISSPSHSSSLTNKHVGAGSLKNHRYHPRNRDTDRHLDQTNDPIVTFDAFFDANDDELSHFHGSFVSGRPRRTDSSSCDDSHYDNNDYNPNESSEFNLSLKELSLTFHLDTTSGNAPERSGVSVAAVDSRTCLVLRMGDCNVATRRSYKRSDMSVGIGFLEIEDGYGSCLLDGDGERALPKEFVLHFVEEDSTTDNQIQIPSPNECISITSSTIETGKRNPKKNTEVSVRIAPLQLYYKERTIGSIRAMTDLTSSQTTDACPTEMNGEVMDHTDPTTTAETSLRVDLRCDYVTVSLPLHHANDSTCFLANGNGANLRTERFFERCGYTVEYPDGLNGPILSVVVSDVSVNLSKNTSTVVSPQPANGTDDCYDTSLPDDLSVVCTCQKALCSLSAPISSRRTDPYITTNTPPSDSVFAYRMDFLSLESETRIDPDAIIKLEYTQTSIDGTSETFKRRRAKKFFPVVTQLSVVKASQRHESEDIDQTYKSYDGAGGRQLKPTNLAGPTKNIIRGSDPQAVMLKEAGRCATYVSLQIPSIVADLSSQEILDVTEFVTRPTPECNGTVEGTNTGDGDDIDAVVDTVESPSIGFSFKCDQLSIALHEEGNVGNGVGAEAETEGKHEKDVYSQMIICDGIRTYCMLESQGVKNTRFVFDDVTLYEVSNLASKKRQSAKYSSDLSVENSISYRCNLIRRRRVDDSSNRKGSVIFFRSKLSHCLSPKTPALIIDTITKRDGEDIERALHVSVYDMTYRYDLDSLWIERLKSMLRLGGPDGDNATSESKASEDDAMAQSVTKLFITISDCNFDYTSPAAFNTASSTIMRFGEVRISSNLIIPAGPVQAFKISVADVSLFLSNKRTLHDVENSRLSCSNLVFGYPKRRVTGSTKLTNHTVPQSFEDALFKMNFISIATLDYLDAAIATAEFNDGNSNRYQGISGGNELPPGMTVTLSIGKACLLTCRDSFACLLGTLDDIIFKMSMPTPEELEVMQLQNVNDKSAKMVEESLSHDLVEVEQQTNFMEQNSAPICEDNASSLAEVAGHDLFSNVVGDFEARTASVLPIDHPHEKAQSEQNANSIQSETVLIHDFYCIEKKDVALTNASCVDNSTGQDSLTGNWTTVDYSWSRDTIVPAGEEQCGGWYSMGNEGPKEPNEMTKSHLMLPDNFTVIVEGKGSRSRVPRVFPRHVLINPVSDPLAGGDMGASKFTNTKTPPRVRLRIMIKEMSVCCRFFDGYDWKVPKKFLRTDKRNDGQKRNGSNPSELDSKTQLMGELFGNNIEDTEDRMFEESEVTSTSFRVASEYGTRRKCRQPNRLFQFCFYGLKLRCDVFADCVDHCLASCMDLSLRDMFVSETISTTTPVKLIGEWTNDNEHPRDSNDGLVMMKMVSVHPDKQVSADGKLMGNESRVTLELLPIRCYIHQHALRFIRDFFKSDDIPRNNNEESTPGNSPPETFFPVFKVKPFKVKVDYTPCEIDTSALKDGNFIEILNLLPLEEMVLKLKAVELRNLTGWGSVFSELVCKWVQDVSSTQIHKFLTTTSPLHPIANVGDGVKQFVMIPLEEYRQRGHVRKALQRGTVTLAEIIAYETLNISSKLTNLAARKLGGNTTNNETSDLEPFPMRPETTPRTIGDVSSHAMASLSRGLKEANAKIIIMPYREYLNTGSKGSLKCVMKGIPVAICAPLSGVAEALSYGLLGARNQLRPEMGKEEEAAKKFQHDN